MAWADGCPRQDTELSASLRRSPTSTPSALLAVVRGPQARAIGAAGRLRPRCRAVRVLSVASARRAWTSSARRALPVGTSVREFDDPRVAASIEAVSRLDPASLRRRGTGRRCWSNCQTVRPPHRRPHWCACDDVDVLAAHLRCRRWLTPTRCLVVATCHGRGRPGLVPTELARWPITRRAGPARDASVPYWPRRRAVFDEPRGATCSTPSVRSPPPTTLLSL